MTLLGLEIALSLLVAFLAGAVLLTLALGRAAPRGPRGGPLGPLAVLALLALLALLCVPRHGIAIAGALERSGAALLGGQGIGVRADGRELALTGTVPTEQAKAEAGARVLALPGVRGVTNLLEVAPPPPSPPAAPPSAAVQARLDTLLEARRIEFEPSRDLLTPASLPVLEEVRAVLADAPGLAVRVEGHSDDRGDPAANRALSQARAQVVVDWLAAHGVERGRLEAQGFGPDRPLASNATAAGRARNRRVELIAR